MICFKVIEESLLRFPVLGSQKRKKSMVRLGLSFCLLSMTISQFCRVLQNFCCLKPTIFLLQIYV